MVPNISSVSASAGRAGGRFVGGFVRSSKWAISGQVFVAVFRSASVAGQFARAWGSRLPAVCRGCAVRRCPSGWAVSVPVALAVAAPVWVSAVSARAGFGWVSC